MQNLKTYIVFLVVGVIVCGCKNGRQQSDTTQQPEEKIEQKIAEEPAMGLTIEWLGHASFKISCGQEVIYIDPWKIKDAVHDATLVFVSHSHGDHYSPEDIEKVGNDATKLIASADVIAKEKAGELIVPGLSLDMGSVKFTGVAAYNPNKQFHPKDKQWVGCIIEIGSKRIYYAGDTDVTDEMTALTNIDLALLPVGGKYTMNAEEAASAVRQIKPKLAVPYHWGDIIGSASDAKKFADLADCEVKVLKPGEAVGLE